MNWELLVKEVMDLNQEFKHTSKVATLEAEPFLLVRVALNVDMTRLSIKGNLKSTNSWCHQPIKSLVSCRIRNLQITKLKTTDIQKPNTILPLPKRKILENNPKL